jgi:hypothetical protein
LRATSCPNHSQWSHTCDGASVATGSCQRTTPGACHVPKWLAVSSTVAHTLRQWSCDECPLKAKNLSTVPLSFPVTTGKTGLKHLFLVRAGWSPSLPFSGPRARHWAALTLNPLCEVQGKARNADPPPPQLHLSGGTSWAFPDCPSTAQTQNSKTQALRLVRSLHGKAKMEEEEMAGGRRSQPGWGSLRTIP